MRSHSPPRTVVPGGGCRGAALPQAAAPRPRPCLVRSVQNSAVATMRWSEPRHRAGAELREGRSGPRSRVDGFARHAEAVGPEHGPTAHTHVDALRYSPVDRQPPRAPDAAGPFGLRPAGSGRCSARPRSAGGRAERRRRGRARSGCTRPAAGPRRRPRGPPGRAPPAGAGSG